MRIDAASSALPTGVTGQGGADGLKTEFLKLLVAQLEHQNPLDPTEGSEFVAQLAQLTSVEQAAEQNKRLAAIEAQQGAALGASLAGFVGSEATAQVNGFRWNPDNGGVPDLSLELGADSATTRVTIRDRTGAAVRTLELGAQKSGRVSLGWDGKDASGAPLAAGDYRIEVEAATKGGEKVPTTTRLTGTVDAIEASNGAYYLRVGGISITPAEIISIGRSINTAPAAVPVSVQGK